MVILWYSRLGVVNNYDFCCAVLTMFHGCYVCLFVCILFLHFYCNCPFCLSRPSLVFSAHGEINVFINVHARLICGRKTGRQSENGVKVVLMPNSTLHSTATYR